MISGANAAHSYLIKLLLSFGLDVWVAHKLSNSPLDRYSGGVHAGSYHILYAKPPP
jgi:hypothetical protein